MTEIKKRTHVDFSKHKLTFTESDGARIHVLAQEHTSVQRVVFINAHGVMAVTGDFGNWIFCREFTPSANGRVSDSYWCEKLRIASTQKCSDYDPEATRKQIEERIADEDTSEKEREYYEELLIYVEEGEEVYLAHAHMEKPESLDHDNVPHCTKIKFWLNSVFDAFEEICEREKQTVKTE